MKNYTSEVPVSRTIARIEELLAKAKIRNILKDYEGEQVVALYFTLPNPKKPDESIPVRLPVNIEAVYSVLRLGYSERTKFTTERTRRLMDQARRTAWKLVQDWVEIQLSLIELGQVVALQVFLPYVWFGDATYYQRLEAKAFAALLPAHETLRGQA